MTPERLDMSTAKACPGTQHDLVEALREALDGRELVDPLDAGGLRHAGIVDSSPNGCARSLVEP